jgi:hypothetical protein
MFNFQKNLGPIIIDGRLSDLLTEVPSSANITTTQKYAVCGTNGNGIFRA